MNEINIEFVIQERMKRFLYLLDYSSLAFHLYQKEGIEWCLRQEINPFINSFNKDLTFRGGIIADEMGLGKTITMIGLMYVNIVKKTLIVVPPILMEQWCKQIYKIFGHKAFLYHGKNQKNIEELKKARIVITTYNIISISKKTKIINTLHKIKWNRIIFDEAHHLRNKNTTRFLGSVNLRADTKWLLSGTPIQNKKSDLIHLSYILNPLIMKKKEEIADFLQNIQKNHMLKRTKEMVGLEILPCNINTCVVEWENMEEKKMAQEIHSLVKISNVSDKYTTTFAKQISLSIGGRGGALMGLLRAKQSCITVNLMKNSVQWLVDTNKIHNSYLNTFDFNPSKLSKIIEIIVDRSKNGKGKLLFCQFREEMNYLQNKLIDQGLTCMIIDGRCVGKTRIAKLETPVDVLILQIQTGCEGLNLQEFYSEVYFVSPHWNPSIEDQAIARCHRMGQQKEVEVFKFEMNGFDNEKKTMSLEKHIRSVQETKRGIYNELLINN
jgi:SNF2 family DNA or RNA helicase